MQSGEESGSEECGVCVGRGAIMGAGHFYELWGKKTVPGGRDARSAWEK